MARSLQLRLGTRGSLLAKAQSRGVAKLLKRLHSDLTIELEVVKTTGDQIQDRPLTDEGGKGLFTKEIEQALLDGELDFAVHSYKDVPVTMPLVPQANLTIAAVPRREDPADVLVSLTAKSLAELPKGAIVGTSSLRRRCQLLKFTHLRIEPIRGNIDTRLKKLRDGEFAAIILAAAGLKRAGLFDEAIAHPIPLEEMLPAAGQGALALQCRRDDSQTRELLSAMNDPATAMCVDAEREVVRRLGGDCQSPIAVLATVNLDKTFRIRALVGTHGGELPTITATAMAAKMAQVVDKICNELEASGARKLLHKSD